MGWKQKRLILFDFIIPVAILMVLTIVFWVTDLDLVLQNRLDQVILSGENPKPMLEEALNKERDNCPKEA